MYRGVFGSHVANVLRRLRRLARIYDADPQFLLASATIANAGELALELTGRAGDRGRSGHVCREPSARSSSGTRRSSTSSSACGRARSATRRGSCPQLTSRGLRTICFAKSRKAAELIHRFTAERVDIATAKRLAPYRAGYTAEQRREIERRLVEGELLGVTATDALELGIDIGLLDCAISVGFPGTVASLRQQWGRAGTARSAAWRSSSQRRRARPVLRARARRAALPARRGGDPRPREPAHPRSARPRRRVRGAAGRRRRGHARLRGAPPRGASFPELEHTPAGYVWKGRDYPAARVSLRSGDAEAFTVVDGDDAARSSASSSETARTRPCTRAPSTSTSASSTSCESLDLEDRVAARESRVRRLVHAGEEGVGDDDRASAASRRSASVSSSTSAASR